MHDGIFLIVKLFLRYVLSFRDVALHVSTCLYHIRISGIPVIRAIRVRNFTEILR